MGVSPHDVIVEIDEVVVHGLSGEDSHRFVRALTGALGDVLEDVASQGIDARSLSRLELPPINVGIGTSPDALGESVARAIGRGLVP